MHEAPLHEVPLAPFLATLEADGIVLTPRDHERIQMVLQTGGSWSSIRLRDTLLALLARDPDSQEIFLQRFDLFFTLDPQHERSFDGLDVARALADLRQLADQLPAPRVAVPLPLVYNSIGLRERH